nr:hypothetical protein [Tanacetum cinerariifolium]
MTLLNTLMETCVTLTQKVAHLEQDKVAQALKIIKLKQRVKKLEKKMRSKFSGLKRLRKGGKIAKLDVDEDVTLVNIDTAVEMDADIQGKMEEDVIAVKEINAAKPEPTVFNDEEMTKRLQDEEIKQAAVRENKQIQEKPLDNIKKYQSLKRKPISVAQARKTMIVYLKNMVGYKIQYFKCMTYDQVRPIFEREYNHVQTFLKSDRDEEPTKKRVAKETLFQESFKKLRAEVKVSGSHSTQEEIPTVDPQEMSEENAKNMLQIVPVAEFKVEALQVKEDLDALWRITNEKFSTTKPTQDKEKALGVELKRLYEPNAADKDYPLTDVVLLLMLSDKLQVDEDCEMVRDLVMKIFMEANKPKSEKSLDTSSN